MNEHITHRQSTGYVLWLFGFTGAHRFYYGRPISGTVYFLTFGLLGIGWLVDLFLIPSFQRQAETDMLQSDQQQIDPRFAEGWVNDSTVWILLTFLGIFGAHRMYLESWFTGILYLLTGGIFGLGYLYDFWTLNDQIDKANNFQWSSYIDRGGC